MCGFAGFLTQGPLSSDAAATARTMALAIAHRGPDDEGVWTDSDAGVALAHRRLSIVDLSPAGHQPMVSQSGRFVIAFNGEIYNHRELRQRLLDHGHQLSWRGTSDTEVLIEAIAAWGIEATLKLCAGMFAFALWDRQTRTLTLARDRLGEKPLYYGSSRGVFLFGSELKALARHPAWQGEIDRDALHLYVRRNNVAAPHTIYRGIKKLKPGSIATLHAEESEPRVSTYWDAHDIVASGLDQPFTGTATEAVEQTEALLRQSLTGQMMADVPLGAFLSGGIDSTCIVALMQSLATSPVKTFSIGFGEDGYNEAHYAKLVAAHLGTDHTELYVTGSDAQAVVPRLPQLYCEPFADSSQIPTFLVSQLARQHVTVSLSGDGGDELFAGYNRHQFAHQTWPRLRRVPRPMRAAGARLATAISPQNWNRLLTNRVSASLAGDKLHKLARVAALDDAGALYQALTSDWPLPSAIVVGGTEPRLSTGLAGNVPPARFMMSQDLTGYLADDILVKVDRAAMAVSLETRVPFLDHRLVEFAASLPLHTLMANSETKWPLRRIVDRYVPRALMDRPKAGFAVPIDTWLRGPLREWAEELLDERRLRQQGFFHAAPIRAAWRDHLSGAKNLQHPLWTILMFQAWRESLPATPSQA